MKHKWKRKTYRKSAASRLVCKVCGVSKSAADAMGWVNCDDLPSRQPIKNTPTVTKQQRQGGYRGIADYDDLMRP
jgi:hypothetical protein